MRISRTRFIIIFLVAGFAFQFITNSLLGSEIRLFPANGEWFPGTESPIAWKSTVATILYPVKIVMIGPVGSLFQNPDPDTPPPLFLIAFALYWTVLALVLHYLLSKIITRKS
jgi:hypothetical protein